MQCVPVAHAVTTLVHFPFAPSAIATFPAAMFAIITGTVNGLTRDGFPASILAFACSHAFRSPTPEPTRTPTRNGSSFSMEMPASVNASFAAATAYWEKVPIRLAALKSMRSFATKPLTSPARCTLYSAVSNFVIVPIPQAPCGRRSRIPPRYFQSGLPHPAL